MTADRSARFGPWAAVAALWVAFLLNYFDRQMGFAMYPVLQRELGFSYAQLGLVGSVFLWVYSVSSLLMGPVADRGRKERLIPACLLIWSAATLGTGLSGSPSTFLFWRGMMGVSEALYLPAAVALVASLHQGATRSRAIAAHQTAQMIGIIAGGWGGGWMADHLGWRFAFLLMAGAGIVYAPVLYAVLRGSVSGDSTPRVSAADCPPRERLPRCYWALAAAFAAYCIMLWMLYAWLPLHLYQTFKLTQAESGLAATLSLQLSTAFGVLACGWIADKAVKRTPAARFYVVAAGILLCSPFAYAVMAANSLTGVKLACLGFGLFAGGLHSNLAGAAYDVVSPHRHGVALGALNLIGGISGGLATLTVGVWKDSLPISELMGYGALLSAAGAILLFAVVAHAFDREQVSGKQTNLVPP